MYGDVTWDAYIKALGVVRILSEAFRAAITNAAADERTSPTLGRVILVRRTDLVELISKTKAFGLTESRSAVHALVFDPKLSNVEIWDRPLIPVNADLVLFVPSIIGAGSPVRAIENIIAQWNDHLFGD